MYVDKQTFEPCDLDHLLFICPFFNHQRLLFICLCNEIINTDSLPNTLQGLLIALLYIKTSINNYVKRGLVTNIILCAFNCNNKNRLAFLFHINFHTFNILVNKKVKSNHNQIIKLSYLIILIKLFRTKSYSLIPTTFQCAQIISYKAKQNEIMLRVSFHSALNLVAILRQLSHILK